MARNKILSFRALLWLANFVAKASLAGICWFYYRWLSVWQIKNFLHFGFIFAIASYIILTFGTRVNFSVMEIIFQMITYSYSRRWLSTVIRKMRTGLPHRSIFEWLPSGSVIDSLQSSVHLMAVGKTPLFSGLDFLWAQRWSMENWAAICTPISCCRFHAPLPTLWPWTPAAYIINLQPSVD